MIIPPSNIQELYQRLLTDNSIPKNLHFYYKKWFRYYWDFCHQYKATVNDQNSLPLFKKKLFEKNQNKYQVQQAVDAILIYYRHINKLPDLNLNQNDKKNTL
ncbi:MAG: hypothetical protein OMM_14284 [Candidatus Magnetoglobus multicellularis str. Araruama]|uniref:Integrase SAM-like N-terminal domain-containing protein n=1 Tax=Candidatus Magnetoglobus multicellularis str. Araruama TaxID=890399 RepID=A0A1V1NS64_9BACT|nr:MAG: hypothetical protein OMM_14284 [Candidatus Magnetoglobus multicellularis str. Araruama]